MEQDFGNGIEKKKLGGGIIALAVLTFIGAVISLFSNIYSLISLDATNKILQDAGYPAMTSTQFIISIVVSVISAAGFILILRWKKLGVYLYYAAFVLGLAVSIMNISASGAMAAFGYIGIGVSLIIPILLAIFLRNKFKYFE